MEYACRDQIPYLWLTGWQHPDHNTLWRFYQRHRQGMRQLFKRTMRTAVAMDLVDLAVQAAYGTRVAANASVERSYTGEQLERLLDRVECTIEELEAQNEGGEDCIPARLPDQLSSRKALRQRIKQAMDDLPDRERPNRYKRPHRINLTDGDAKMMKTRQGITHGYNGQVMVFPLASGREMNGMLITDVDLADDSYDNGMLIPMMEQAEETTGTKATMTLADSGYFAGRDVEECDRRGWQVVMPEARRKLMTNITKTGSFMTNPRTPSCVRRSKLFDSSSGVSPTESGIEYTGP